MSRVDYSKSRGINLYKILNDAEMDIKKSDVINIINMLLDLKSRKLFDVNQQQNFISKVNQKILNNINEGKKFSNLNELMKTLVDGNFFDITEITKRRGAPYDNYILMCKDWDTDNEILNNHVAYLSSISKQQKYKPYFTQKDIDEHIEGIIDEIAENCGKFLNIRKKEKIEES